MLLETINIMKISQIFYKINCLIVNSYNLNNNKINNKYPNLSNNNNIVTYKISNNIIKITINNKNFKNKIVNKTLNIILKVIYYNNNNKE